MHQPDRPQLETFWQPVTNDTTEIAASHFSVAEGTFLNIVESLDSRRMKPEKLSKNDRANDQQLHECLTSEC